MKTYLLLLLFGSWVTGGGLPVQKTYSLSGDYTVSIHGTFSIHDWSETIGKVSGELVGTAGGDGSAMVQSIRIVMQVRSIKGDMGSVMNNKTYKALKGDADPEITFVLTGPVTLNRIAAGNKAVAVKATLTLAGVTRAVLMSVISFTVTPGKMHIEGEEKIKMTDFGVKPPSALFGTMRAAPEITINFKTDFTIQQQ
jgi:polyisoprenoid-binding protein YceI